MWHALVWDSACISYCTKCAHSVIRVSYAGAGVMWIHARDVDESEDDSHFESLGTSC